MTSTTAVDDPAARQLRDALANSLVAGANRPRYFAHWAWVKPVTG